MKPRHEPRMWRTMTSIVGARSPAFIVELHHRREQPLDTERWRHVFSTAGRRLGADALDPRAAERLADVGIDWALTLDQLARAVLLLELESRVAPDGFPLMVAACYRTGDSREREAILRSLPLLGEPARHAELAIDACRSSVVSVFAAIACDNPFPRDHFGDRAFNQLALKAVFLGLPVAEIRGLQARRGEELGRMAADYARELSAAGRPIPGDLSLLGAS